ncbi:hypothetical protein ACFQ3J_04370 [Paenibacillus provencensis]|uniref:Transcription elongation factor GreA/GreB C-terminal domain-containing protein n=1 Tax=Paenibacillus provencensis TaxID=441151 RepID=A0ABW3PUB2_9BACL|nr:hypothetical protein [Paenibacillus sp. MER 78]MCM3126891.1 hypothetical protein [Paenibacillus sp. MER 78]
MIGQMERYYELKKLKKEIEDELSSLRQEMIEHLIAQNTDSMVHGEYEAKIVVQSRKEYDDELLYQALPDPEVWKLMSKADTGKIASLIKLGILSEEGISHTYETRRTELLIVNKK